MNCSKGKHSMLNKTSRRLTVIYGRNHTIGSSLLRLKMWCVFSHVGIIDGDYVIESIAKHGVIRTTIEEFKSRYTAWAIGEYLIDCDPAEAIERARSRIGCKYDWLAILGIGLRTGWDSTNRFVCSELIAWAGKGVNDNLIRRYDVDDALKHTQIVETSDK